MYILWSIRIYPVNKSVIDQIHCQTIAEHTLFIHQIVQSLIVRTLNKSLI